jgi:membrane protease subunit (stomatin/prohibitin family)
MMRRRGGAGIVGTVARTAVIAGTATAVSNKVSERQYNKSAQKQQAQMADEAAFSNQAEIDQMQAQMQAMQAQQMQAAASPPDLTTKLQQLAELKASGVLSDEEFAAAKAKLLS